MGKIEVPLDVLILLIITKFDYSAPVLELYAPAQPKCRTWLATAAAVLGALDCAEHRHARHPCLRDQPLTGSP